MEIIFLLYRSKNNQYKTCHFTVIGWNGIDYFLRRVNGYSISWQGRKDMVGEAFQKWEEIEVQSKPYGLNGLFNTGNSMYYQEY